jgi:AmiR/NasT family two-component response regulator
LFPDSDPPRLGALNLYSRRPGGLAAADLDVASVLAAHLAIALAVSHRGDRDRAEVSDLRAALRSRDVIGQAKGILMARGGLTADEAFEVLVRASQRLNTKLRDLAEQVARDPTMEL